MHSRVIFKVIGGIYRAGFIDSQAICRVSEPHIGLMNYGSYKARSPLLDYLSPPFPPPHRNTRGLGPTIARGPSFSIGALNKYSKTIDSEK